ncbi:MAG: exodeoxyribonuclease VII large subunit, partial [Candidatus Acidiferrales bacterium]
ILRRRIGQQRQSLQAALERLVTRKQRRFAAAHVSFARIDLSARVGKLRHALDECAGSLEVGIDRVLIAKRRRFEAAQVQLRERNPENLLERGYAIAYDASGKVLHSADQVAIGEDISVRLARGQLDATVRRKK